MGSTRDFVIEVAEQLNRSAEDVEQYVLILEENWYDSKESLADASTQDLTSLGIPQRFAKELVNALQEDGARSDDGGTRGTESASRSKGKSKGKSKEGKGKEVKSKGKDGKSKGKGGKEKGKDDKSKGKGKDRTSKGKEIRRPGGRMENPDKDNESLYHAIDLDLDNCDTGFPFRDKIVGDSACNVRHIQDKTGAKVRLRGRGSGFKEADTHEEADEPMYIQIRAQTQDELDKAADQVMDLLNAVFDEYNDWKDQFGNKDDRKKSSSSKGKGKGKSSKGKGKTRDRDRSEDRDRKRRRRD